VPSNSEQNIGHLKENIKMDKDEQPFFLRLANIQMSYDIRVKDTLHGQPIKITF